MASAAPETTVEGVKRAQSVLDARKGFSSEVGRQDGRPAGRGRRVGRVDRSILLAILDLEE
jgi:hypothetical protein